jgi:hypothetical protein
VKQLKPKISAIRQGAGRVIYSAPLLAFAAVLVLTAGGLAVFLLTASGDQVLPQRSIRLSDANAGATTTYKLSFTVATPDTLGSISATFCSNDPLITDPCTVPDGFDISGATLSAQTGETGFSIGTGTTANQLILTRSPAISSAQPSSYTLDNVVNPSANGSYYIRLQTYSSDDATGSETDHGGIAFAINSQISISAKVPPYLLFCGGISIPSFDCATATGNYINFGNLSPASTGSAQTQLHIATNAGNGYAIDYGGTTLTSGNNTIPPLDVADVSRPGVSQFGINLAANQDPAIGQNKQGPGAGSVTSAYAQPNLYKFLANDVIATSTGTSDYTRYTVSYVANISKTQPAGVYASTLTYVALANF